MLKPVVNAFQYCAILFLAQLSFDSMAQHQPNHINAKDPHALIESVGEKTSLLKNCHSSGGKPFVLGDGPSHGFSFSKIFFFNHMDVRSCQMSHWTFHVIEQTTIP